MCEFRFSNIAKSYDSRKNESKSWEQSFNVSKPAHPINQYQILSFKQVDAISTELN